VIFAVVVVGLTRVSGNWTFRSPTWTAGGVSRSTVDVAVVVVVAGVAAATLGCLEADGSKGAEAVGGLATPVKTTERRFEELLPKLLMRLKKRLVRLPLGSSVEMIDAEPGRTSSLAGTGPGVAALERPKDLRRSECRERWSGEGGLVGMGGRKA
jgi:hypothetical protein